MVNQYVIPSSGAAAGIQPYPQPISKPFITGPPAEGPKSFIVFATIPTGQSGGEIDVNVSQIGLSGVQALCVNNQQNLVGVTITTGPDPALPFAVPPACTQMQPVFQSGHTLKIAISLAAPAGSPVSIAIQIFNTFQNYGQWFSSLTVNGNVNIVSGSVSITGGTVSVSGALDTAIMAAASGGCTPKLIGALTNVVQQIKGSAGVLKTLEIDNTGAATVGTIVYVQVFDSATPGGVTLGTTTPKLSFPAAGLQQGVSPHILPPEGVQFANGIQVAATTALTGAGAPAVPPNINATYF